MRYPPSLRTHGWSDGIKAEICGESQPVKTLEEILEREADGGHQGKRVEVAKTPVQFRDVDKDQPGVFRLVRQGTSSPENSAF
jgi:hypothetical protein